MVKPEGDATTYSPADGLFLLFKDSFVLAEAAAAGEDLERDALAESLNDDDSMASDYAAPADGADAEDPNGVPAGFSGFCLEPETGGHHIDESDSQTRSDVCVNVSEILGTEVNFVDIAILTNGVVEGVTKETETSYHLLADKRGDRIMAVHTPAFLGSSGSFIDNITEVRVGRTSLPSSNATPTTFC
ncbi:MAG: hypothetical protein GY822_22970 [Deltaproteobacteria bacterium]|nr:hypothetical protein [Deltaproteobacteria bacterium]